MKRLETWHPVRPDGGAPPLGGPDGTHKRPCGSRCGASHMCGDTIGAGGRMAADADQPVCPVNAQRSSSREGASTALPSLPYS